MLYIFDKDHTIVENKNGDTFINRVEDQVLMPGVAEKCTELRAAEYILAVASNQGSIPFDIMTYAQAQEIVAHAAGLIEASLFIFCPHHPKGKNKYAIECFCRKPQPGMLIDLMEMAEVRGCTFIGDREEDRGAAEAACKAGYKVRFEWAKEYFGEG